MKSALKISEKLPHQSEENVPYNTFIPSVSSTTVQISDLAFTVFVMWPFLGYFSVTSQKVVNEIAAFENIYFYKTKCAFSLLSIHITK